MLCRAVGAAQHKTTGETCLRVVLLFLRERGKWKVEVCREDEEVDEMQEWRARVEIES